MKLTWLTSWVNRKTNSPRRCRSEKSRRVGTCYVPRLEPLEGRNLPSGLPTVILSDGTVLQMTAATTGIVTVPNQGTTSLASDSAGVTVRITYLLEPNFVFVQLASTDGAFAPKASFTLNSVITDPQGSDASGFPFPTISTTFFLSGMPEFMATNYVIGLQTRINQSNADLHVSIAGFDLRGNPSSDFATAIQVNDPVATNRLPLPTIPDNGKMSFDMNTPPSGLAGPYDSNTGSSGLTNQPFPGLDQNQSNTVVFATNGGNFISIFTLIELGGGDSRNPPLPFTINEIPPGSLEKTSFAPTITNSTSLVLADTGPSSWLTLSIMQDSYLRATSASAQITWIGRREPAEAPVHRAAASRKGEFLLETITAPSQELGSAVNEETSVFSPMRSRPMEAMVSDILRSLPQAKRDEKEEEISLAAQQPLPSPSPGGGEDGRGRAGDKGKSQASLDWHFAGTVVGLLGTARLPGADDPLSLPDLENDSAMVALIPAEGSALSGNQPQSSSATTRRPVSEQRRWLHLAEEVGGFLLLLTWPAILDFGRGRRESSQIRGSRIDNQGSKMPYQ